MTSIQTRLTLASQRAAGLRTFQILSDHDRPKLEAFFLSFDFDQRRAFFGAPCEKLCERLKEAALFLFGFQAEGGHEIR